MSPNTEIDFARAAEQTGPHIFLIGTRGRVWTLDLYLKVHFSASSQHCSTGPLNCCKVSSHTHQTLLSHWVQTAFVTSTQQGFPLASIYTHALSGWLPALLISSFAPPAFLKVTEMLPSCARDRWLVESKYPDLGAFRIWDKAKTVVWQKFCCAAKIRNWRWISTLGKRLTVH